MCLAVLDGAIVCALARHVLGALVSAPPLLMFAVAGLTMVALFRFVCTKRLLLCFLAGIVCGFTLPASLPSPHASIITHAAARFAHADLFDALEQLDERPQELVGRRITVTGSWHPRLGGAAAAVSRHIMACCAADAVDVGFDVEPSGSIAASEGAAVRVTGIVQISLRNGETRYSLRDASVTPM